MGGPCPGMSGAHAARWPQRSAVRSAWRDNWTPQGFVGQIFKVIGRHVRPPAGVKAPGLWGTRERLDELFGAHAALAADLESLIAASNGSGEATMVVPGEYLKW